MKRICLLLSALCLLSTSCEKNKERMIIDETRGITSKDGDPKLFASSNERFRNAKPSSVTDKAPESWLALPPAQFRELNYRFGESGLGEVYVSLSGGNVGDNVNRWLQQFGRDVLSPADLGTLAQTEIAGTRGVMVEAVGEYAGGMGSDPKPGYALAGVIAEVNGKILTVKMVGPEPEVEKEKAKIAAYAASLALAE